MVTLLADLLEQWIRANMGSFDRPTGKIATMMSTINQSWNPPMSAQDEFNDILVEMYNNNIKRYLVAFPIMDVC